MKRKTTADRLKQIMSERNIKQVDVLQLAKPYCKQFDVTLGKSALSQYVSGKVEPNQYKLFVLGLALNVSEAWLMGYDVPMERGQVSSADSTQEQEAAHAVPLRTVTLRPDEAALLGSYNKLNDTGKEKAAEYVTDLAGNKKYTVLEDMGRMSG